MDELTILFSQANYRACLISSIVAVLVYICAAYIMRNHVTRSFKQIYCTYVLVLVLSGLWMLLGYDGDDSIMQYFYAVLLGGAMWFIKDTLFDGFEHDFFVYLIAWGGVIIVPNITICGLYIWFGSFIAFGLLYSLFFNKYLLFSNLRNGDHVVLRFDAITYIDGTHINDTKEFFGRIYSDGFKFSYILIQGTDGSKNEISISHLKQICKID